MSVPPVGSFSLGNILSAVKLSGSERVEAARRMLYKTSPQVQQRQRQHESSRRQSGRDGGYGYGWAMQPHTPAHDPMDVDWPMQGIELWKNNHSNGSAGTGTDDAYWERLPRILAGCVHACIIGVGGAGC